jgi:hypothetical protein
LCHKVEGDPHSLAPKISGVASQLSALRTLKDRIGEADEKLGALTAEQSELIAQQPPVILSNTGEIQAKARLAFRTKVLKDKLAEAKTEVELLHTEATEAKAKLSRLHLVCFYFSGKGLLLNSHRFTCVYTALLGICLLLLNLIVSPAGVPQEEEGSVNEEISPSSVYVMLKQHCDYVPANAVDAYFEFWTIWLLIAIYCMASTLFVFRHLLLYVLVYFLGKLWTLFVLAMGFVRGDLAVQPQKKGCLDVITKWLERQTGAAAGWFNHAQVVNEETDHIDKSTSTLMFISGWILADV